jgi:repressor LexA
MLTEVVTSKELEAIREIRNSLMRAGRIPSMRELMSSLGYQSPRSASLLVDKLIKKGALRRKRDGRLQFVRSLGDDTTRAQTVDVPLVGAAACGTPIMAEENIQAMMPVSTKLARPPHRYFLLRAQGDSMDQKGIHDGDLVLVRQQTAAKDGDMVVALVDDEATIKEFRIGGDTYVLKPRSSNKIHQPIILTKDFQIQGVVVRTIPMMEDSCR